MRTLPRATLALFFVLVSACSKTSTDPVRSQEEESTACTLLGCTDGFRVTLAANDDAFPDGDYEVLAQADRRAIQRCRIAVRGDRASKSGDCEHIEVTIWGGKNTVGELIYVANEGELTSLQVLFAKDGRALAERTIEPIYRTNYPNGERCGGGCRNADSVKIPIDM